MCPFQLKKTNMLPIFGVLHICAFLKRPFLQLLHSALADLHVCSLHPGYLVLRSTWYLPLLYHFASSFPVSTALGDITCNSPAIWVGLVVGGKTWRGRGKRGKRRNWVFFLLLPDWHSILCAGRGKFRACDANTPPRHATEVGE